MRVKTVVMTMPRVQILLVLTIAHVMMDLKAMVHTAKVGEKYLEDITRSREDICILCSSGKKNIHIFELLCNVLLLYGHFECS